MATEDVDVAFNEDRGKARRDANEFSRRMSINIHPRPDALVQYDSNKELQKGDPLWYGPYLDKGQCYHKQRSDEIRE